MSYSLGINCSGLHSSACLLRGGEVRYAVCEERLSRTKQDRAFPHRAIAYCLEAEGIDLEDVRDVFVGWNPRFYLQQSDRTGAEAFQSRGKVSYLALNELASALQADISAVVQSLVHTDGQLNIHFVDHHRAHVAGAYFLSGFEHAAFLVLDGFGEHSTGLSGSICPGQLSIVQQYRTPHSLGAFYSVFTDFLGFAPNDEEWKVMALAGAGDPSRFYDKIRALVSVDGLGFELDLSYFEHFLHFTPDYYSPKFVETFGPPRRPGDDLSQHHYDLVAAAQRVTEETILSILRTLHEASGEDEVVLGGGTFMNSVCNGKLLDETPFQRFFIGGSPDDSGVSLGSALHGAHFTTGELEGATSSLGHNYFGRSYETEDIRAYLDSRKVRYAEVQRPTSVAAELLRDGKVVAWFQGGSEFGQRALGHRSILADPTRADTRDKVNDVVKYRESFRPFGAAVLQERQSAYFEVGEQQESRYMECVVAIRQPWRKRLPGIIHIDGTSRLHTVHAMVDPDFHELLVEFERRSGVAVLLNTSFNTRGMPLVESPEDAIHCFAISGLDALVLDRFLILK